MRLVVCLLIGVVLTTDVFSQSSAGEPRFDVASVRPSPNVAAVPAARLAGDRYFVSGLTAGQLIGTAFGEERPLARQQLIGPQWLAGREPIQVLVIDAVSPPTAN